MVGFWRGGQIRARVPLFLPLSHCVCISCSEIRDGAHDAYFHDRCVRDRVWSHATTVRYLRTTKTVVQPICFAHLMLVTESSSRMHAAGPEARTSEGTPAASIAAAKEAGLCFVSSLHVRVSTMTEKRSSTVEGASTLARQREACSLVDAVKTNLLSFVTHLLITSRTAGSGSMSE